MINKIAMCNIKLIKKYKMTQIKYSIIFLVLFISSCNNDVSKNNSSDTGIGGSMARFIVVGNYLYTVEQGKLSVFNVSNPEKPVSVKKISLWFNIETIFANNNILFIGSDRGMYIYNITDPTNPEKLSLYEHIYSCDPVVANDSIAYVTLHTETFCGRNTNELQVVNIRDKRNPVFEKSISMTKPLGLGFEGNILFVCDSGLNVFSLIDPYNPSFVKKFNIPAIDVIASNNILMVIAENGLHQYSYQNDTIIYLSHIQ
jgi:hypothetical protein